MAVPLLAVLPPQVLWIWPTGFLLVLVIAGFLVTATRTRAKRSERAREGRASSSWPSSAVPGGGALLAWLGNTLCDVNPLDVAYTYVVFTVIGGIAGLLAGIIFGVTGLLCPRDESGKGAKGAGSSASWMNYSWSEQVL